MINKERHFYEFGPFRIDPHHRLLLRANQSVPVQPKAFDILLVLIQNSEEVVLKDDLMKTVWPGTFVEESNLAQNISVLRKTLGDAVGENRYIVTVPGRGYRFVEKVQVIPAQAGDTLVESHPRSRASVDAVGSLGNADAQPMRDASLAPQKAEADRFELDTPLPVRSVVVLALENLSGDPDQEYFADGLTDELTTSLAGIAGLRVISRTSAMQYKKTPKRVPDIARELGVDAVVEGTIERSAERVRLRVQLIEGPTDRHLWAETYDRPLADVLTLESEFAQDVARQLRPRFSRQTALPAGDRPLNPVAFEKYLKGLYFWNRRYQEGMVKAAEYFQQATEIDASYAPPYAGLAKCYIMLGGDLNPPSQYLWRARSAASQALSLDPTLSEAHSALAAVNLYDYNFTDAEREHKLAISLRPNDATAHHWYGVTCLMPMGRLKEAFHEIELARGLDPVAPIIRSQRALTLWYMGRHDEAYREASEVIEMAPNFAEAYVIRGGFLMLQGRSQEALADFEKAKRADDTPRRSAWLGWALGVAGERSRASSILSDLKTLRKEKYVSPWMLAIVCLGLNDRDQTFVWLDQAYQDRCLDLIFLQCTPIYDPVRSDPRFADLVRRVGIPYVREAAHSAVLGGDGVEFALESHTRSRLVVEERRLPIPHRWSLRKTVASAAVLAIASTALYLYTHRVPKLTAKDTVVLADLVNTTGDSVFDVALRQGLSAQLAQSPFLNLLSDQTTAHTLALMGQPKDAQLKPELAREVCQRAQGTAVLDPSIAQIGTRYLLTLKAIACSNGETLASTEAEATDKNHVLDALGRTASDIRRKLGESLASVQKYDVRLEDVTTSSLDALRAYALARKALSANRAVESVDLYKQAIKLDPSFAMAYSGLAVNYFNLDEQSQSAESVRKAYDLRERVSEREKLAIELLYYAVGVRNFEAARQSAVTAIQIYPHEWAAISNLGVIYTYLGDYERSLACGQETLQSAPDNLQSYTNLLTDYLHLNRLDEAETMASEAKSRNLDSPFVQASLYQVKFLKRDTAAMEHEAAQVIGKPGFEDLIFYYESDAAAYGGQFVKARDLTRRAADSASRAGQKETAAEYEAEAAVQEGLVGNLALAKQQAKRALTLSNGREVTAISAIALALAGDSVNSNRMADDLGKHFPEDTPVNYNLLPAIRAASALQRGDPGKGIAALAVSATYELGQTAQEVTFVLYPVYLRGEAYLAANKGAAAAAEFQKILDHPGLVQNEPIGALAYLGLGRAYALAGDRSKGKTAYQDFLTLWKDADPDLTILKEAKAEYAKLQ